MEVPVIMRAFDPEVVDAVWEAVEGLLPALPVDAHPLGCHGARVAERVCFEGILVRLVTGCAWVDAEPLLGGVVSDSTLRTRRDEWLGWRVRPARFGSDRRVRPTECAAVELEGGATGPAVDARFVGHNQGGPFGLMRWSRHGRVLTAERAREFVFATEEGGREGTVWRYGFEPVDGATRVTESYHVDWIPLWARIVDVPTNRAKELREGMRHTLGQLKTAAESVIARGALS